jgi:SP family sugar:H+ symporter-like MFS transporter
MTPHLSPSLVNNPTGNFLIGFLTPFANDGIGYGFGFVFVGCNIAAALLVYFFLYESKALSLENVDAMYSEPALKAWKSNKWVPAGYIDRNTRDHAFFQRRTSILDDTRYPHAADMLDKDARSDEEKSETPVRRSAHKENLGGADGERRV